MTDLEVHVGESGDTSGHPLDALADDLPGRVDGHSEHAEWRGIFPVVVGDMAVQEAGPVRRGLRAEYPKIARQARAEGAEICWGDETGLRSDESRHRGYAPRGQTPVLRIPVRRTSLSVISSITNQGTVRFMIYKGALRPAILLRFLQRLTRGQRRRIFLILDNLRVHKARRVMAWVARHAAQIRLFFLPPYSPELNPDEYLNGDLKRGVHTGIPPRDAADLKRQTLSQLRSIQRSPTRVRAYFEHQAIQYAA